MFTGIIEAVGYIVSKNPQGGDVALRIASGDLDLSDVKLGDSIATNGVCLTVVAQDNEQYTVTAIQETLEKTKTLRSHFGSSESQVWWLSRSD